MTKVIVKDLKLIKNDERINKISFSLDACEILGLGGIKKSGLKALGEILMGLNDEYEGSCKIVDLEVKNNRSYLKKVGLYNRDVSVYPDLYGKDLIKNAYILKGLKEDKAEISYLMDILSIGENTLNKKLKVFSSYEVANLDLLLAHLGKPEIVILEDPSPSLREYEVENFKRLIIENNKKGVSYIILSPFAKVLEDLCSRVLYLEEGSIISKEEYHALRKKEYDLNVKKLRGL